MREIFFRIRIPAPGISQKAKAPDKAVQVSFLVLGTRSETNFTHIASLTTVYSLDSFIEPGMLSIYWMYV
jgi:hypothetical protein